MVRINRRAVCPSDDGAAIVAEASTIGLAPGEWPDWIAVVDEQNRGVLFGFPRQERGWAGDVQAVHYTSEHTAIELVVVND